MTSLRASGLLPAADSSRALRRVAVLLEAPRPESVPRGVVDAVGEKYAVRLFRVIARRTIESIEHLGWVPVGWYAPADALPEIRRWLGDEIALEPRPSGGFPATLLAIAEMAAPDGTWLAVRPAGAGLTPDLIERAGQAVEDGGVAFGATTREEVYLLGGPPEFAAFLGTLPWDQPGTALTLRSRLREAGAGWAELPRLIDVCNGDDLRAAGLLT